jgi:hypothetical protein
MPFDFSPYRVASGEKPASSTKFNNFLQVVQDGMNAMPPANLLGFPSDASKFLDGAGGWSVPVTDMAAVYLKTTAFDLVNNAALVDLLQGSIIIPASKLGPNAAIKIFAGGSYLNNSGANRQLRVVLALGPQTIWDPSMSDPMTGNTGRRGWHFFACIQAMGSTGVQMTSGYFMINNPGTATVGLGKLNSTVEILAPFQGAGTTVNMTGSQVLAFSAQHSVAHALCSMKLEYARVEVSA